MTRVRTSLTIGAGIAILAQFVLLGQPASAATVPAGTLVFAHEESGSTDPSQQYSNLYAMNPQIPTTRTRLTNFGYPTTVEWPVWSKDFHRLAFVSNVNDGFRSLEAKSVYTIAANGSDLRQVTGFGLINPLSPTTGSVTGHVQANGQLSSCFVSLQGDSNNPPDYRCNDTDGSFIITGFPAGANWVRAQATVTDSAGGPGFSMGWVTPVRLTPGMRNDVGAITLSPNIPESDEPAWSTDDSHLITTLLINGKSNATGPWTAYKTNQLVVWSADGASQQGIANPPGIQFYGEDWSPAENRICFAATGSSAGQSWLYLADPNGGNPFLLYTVPSPTTGVLSDVISCRWSPDGQRVAFIQFNQDSFQRSWSDLYVINRDGTNLLQLTNDAPSGLGNGAFAVAPTWSPDKQDIAFEGDVHPGSPVLPPTSADLYAINLTTRVLVQLTTDHRSSNPTWGPTREAVRSAGALPRTTLRTRLGPPPPVPGLPAAPHQAQKSRAASDGPVPRAAPSLTPAVRAIWLILRRIFGVG